MTRLALLAVEALSLCGCCTSFPTLGAHPEGCYADPGTAAFLRAEAGRSGKVSPRAPGARGGRPA